MTQKAERKSAAADADDSKSKTFRETGFGRRRKRSFVSVLFGLFGSRKESS